MTIKYYKRKAFTLIELVIVIAVIGVLAAVLIPTFTSIITDSKVAKETANATNLTKLIMQDNILNESTFADANSVKTFLAGSGYTLDSNIDGYAYFYDSDTAVVSFQKIDTVVESAPIDTASILTTYADDDDNRGCIEALSKSNPTLLYIDCSDNAITTAINTINNLVSKAKETDDDALDNRDILTNMANLINKIKPETIAGVNSIVTDSINNYIDTFNPTNTLYIAEDDVYCSSENDTVHKAVVDASTTIISVSTTANYTVKTPIVIPATVVYVSSNLFTTITNCTVQKSSTTNVDTSNLSSTSNVTIENNNAFDKIYETIDLLIGNDYTIGYTTTEYVTTNFTSTRTATEDYKISYAIPSVTFTNLTDVINRNYTIKSKLYTDAVGYTAIGIDDYLNVTTFDNVGYITDLSIDKNIVAGITDNKYNPNNSTTTITVNLPTAVTNFINYSGATITVNYTDTQTEYGYSPFDGWGITNSGTSIDESVDTTATGLLSDSYEFEIASNNVTVISVEITLNGTTLFTKNY